MHGRSGSGGAHLTYDEASLLNLAGKFGVLGEETVTWKLS